MKRRFVAALCAIGLLTGCQSATPVVTDISSSKIALPVVKSGEVPQYSRVVALANGSAEIIAALGFKNILVGRDVASTLPDIASTPIDNPGHSISTELVLSQKPDLIIVDANSSPQSAITQLKKSGIRVASIKDSFTVASIIQKESEIASLLGTPQAGALLAKDVQNISRTSNKTKVLFLYLRGTASIYLIGGKGSGADSLLHAMGLRDVGAEKLAQPFSAMTAEELITLDPDVILLMTKGLESVGGVDVLVALPGIAQTRAGKERRVVTVDDSLLLSFGPRTPGLIALLRSALVKAAA